MIRVNCETFDWGWCVVITRVSGLKETPISEVRYNALGAVNSPYEAMVSALQHSHAYLVDVPEVPEHS